VAGNVVKTIDGGGYQTAIAYVDNFGWPDAEARLNASSTELGTQSSYALPSLVTNALGHTAYTQYDYYTGKAVDVEDVNGVTSSAYYNDDLDPPTQVVRAASDTTLRSQTTYSYDDVNRIVTTTSGLTAYGDQLLKSQTLSDGMGRTTETRNYETATAYVTTKQTYDALGRATKVSNPYRSGQTVVWTTSAYDALGRVVSVTTPDNAVVSTIYSGNTVTVTDQAGKDRQSTTDALGRPTQIIEDPGTGGLGYITAYTHDVLGNLKTATQGAQTRTFTYDSLSRLKSAVNPESGTISYLYDNNSNLTQKTDARSISTTFTYDALNRPTLKNYSDTTPDVAYFYDAQALPTGAPSFVRGASTGRLVAVTIGGTSAGSYYGYDALGQTLRRIQQTDSLNYLTDATYNKAGAMTGEIYPLAPSHSGRRTVSYSFDTAGRPSSLTTAATTYAAAASVTGISYAPHGGLVGGVFKEVENGLTDQAKWEAKNSGKLAGLAARGQYGPGNNDCSGTSCRIGLGVNIPLIGTNVLDSRLGTDARPVAESDAQVGDIIRYAKSNNVATHFANFIFRNDDGTPVAFSKSGETVRYEMRTAASLQVPMYGTIRGISSKDSGYYRKR
jgi:YD repeat-containing protein